METLFLLMCTPWTDEARERVISELDGMGADGAAFYRQYYGIVEQYYGVFQKRRVPSPADGKLGDMDDSLMIAVYGELFITHRDWFDNLEDVPEQMVAQAVEKAVLDLADGAETPIAALESTSLSDRFKWQAVVLLQRPKEQLLPIIRAVRDNLPAFEKARKAVESGMAPLMQRFGAAVDGNTQTGLLRLPAQLDGSAVIYPTLALPLSLLVLDNTCYYGLLADKLFRDLGEELSKEELLMGAKALSEKSKMEILLLLKEGSLYNLEIAEQVGLTPATASYHMGTLMSTGFVDLEKRDGKVYYTLAPSGIRRFLSGLSQLLGV